MRCTLLASLLCLFATGGSAADWRMSGYVESPALTRDASRLPAGVSDSANLNRFGFYSDLVYDPRTRAWFALSIEAGLLLLTTSAAGWLLLLLIGFALATARGRRALGSLDPWFAALAGFDRPILHGLCTYGFTGRALLHTMCGSDPAKFRSMEGRFASPVFPGEELTIEMWNEGTGECIFQTRGEDGRVVLVGGRHTFDA